MGIAKDHHGGSIRVYQASYQQCWSWPIVVVPSHVVSRRASRLESARGSGSGLCKEAGILQLPQGVRGPQGLRLGRCELQIATESVGNITAGPRNHTFLLFGGRRVLG